MTAPMQNLQRGFRIKALALFFLAFLFFAWGTGNTSLWDIDEPIYAQSLKDQIAADNLVVPTYNDRLMPDKPALNYWLMWSGVRLLGMNSWGLRIGSALVGALLVLYLIIALRRLYGESIALLSGLLTATALHSTVIFRSATPDPLLILLVTIALLSYLRGYIYPEIRTREFHWAYAAMALATLDKGPIGFLLPGLIIVLFLLLRQQLPLLWKEGRLTTGIPLFLMIMLPWYLAVGIETHWNWDRLFIFEQNIGRFDDSMQGHRGPWFYYLISTFLGMLPWSIFLPQVLHDLWLKRRHFLQHQAVPLFLLIWAGTWIAFFTLSATKLPNYVWEAYPPLFILLAFWFEKIRAQSRLPQTWGLALSFSTLFLVGLALSIFAAWVLPLREPHLPGMVEVGFPYMLAAVFAMLLIWKKHWSAAWASLGVGSIVLSGLLVFVILPPINALKPSRAMGQEIAAIQGKHPYHLASWDWFQPSFLFYAGRGDMPIRHLSSLAELRTVLGETPLYLVCPSRDVSAVEAAIPQDYQVQNLTTAYEIYGHENISLLQIKNLPHAKGTRPDPLVPDPVKIE
ncbi:glycosyltransferase family 39 protein [Acidithiobacillus sp. HP-6]|uniref:ArnT family glycosyltransferase n=1 Tax=unclassified Acidithiobacillus TaxID=2614800 RepID=UPI00187AD5C4|nr:MULTISPECIES: glycosyltransferase family 39 protein [unclassified Acidithiobacillus]MBE7561507.1 glycosyltransferase family 39 protein [Acidithiobacillus sp. HP-6]MBE7570966.1 glycosyltransferase family 39 protein [Acidithiobacillus sp. HP-2]